MMQIVEVREGYIKFESLDTLPVSSFIEIDDSGKKYVAQILQTKNIGNIWICYAKIQFLFNGDIITYDKTIPSKNSELQIFPFETIARNFDNLNPIIVGNFSEKEPILAEKNIFNKNIIISIDNPNNNKLFVSNTIKQFNKTLIIDMLGIFNNEDKVTAGIDFKLPLNTSSLEFMYQDCLNDATAESKNLIKEIFQDLSQYSETVKFVPFTVLKSIIDDMVDREHIFKLLVLKNKLAKFEKLGYFASTIDEVRNLENVLSNKTSIIDLSKLDPIFQNRYLTTILDLIKTQSNETQIILETSNNINKQNLKRVFTDNDLSITFLTHSRFKYINELKTIVDNFIFDKSSTNKEVFKSCKPLLDSISENQYIIVGKNFYNLALATTFEELTLPKTIIEKQITNNTADETTSEQENPSLTEEDLETLEESLNKDSTQEEILLEENEEVLAINKKSDELIEKVSEEISQEKSSQCIFTDDEDENSEDFDSQNIEAVTNTEKIETEEIIIENEISDIEETIESVKNTDEISKLDLSIEEDIIEEDITNGESLEENLETIEEDEEELDEIVIEPLTEESLEKDLSAVAQNDEKEELEFSTEVDEIHTIEIPKDISDLADDNLELIQTEDANIIKEDLELEPSTETIVLEEDNNAHTDDIGFKDFTNEAEFIAPEPMASQKNFEEDDFDEIIELDESEISDDDILIDIDDTDTEILDEDSLDKQIVEDVDKVFTTMRDDSISDSDLDFIDELNSTVETEELILDEGLEELSGFTEFEDGEDEEGFIEPLEEISDYNSTEKNEDKEILETRQSATPIVPVYGAEIPPEDIVMSDTIEQGDTVTHAKYGIGVVEKMIKYGTKTLYSINFDNVGRRLLDPTLTEIKKS